MLYSAVRCNSSIPLIIKIMAYGNSQAVGYTFHSAMAALHGEILRHCLLSTTPVKHLPDRRSIHRYPGSVRTSSFESSNGQSQFSGSPRSAGHGHDSLFAYQPAHNAPTPMASVPEAEPMATPAAMTSVAELKVHSFTLVSHSCSFGSFDCTEANGSLLQ